MNQLLSHRWPHYEWSDLTLTKLSMFAVSISAELEMTIDTPACSPWVLDKPVIFAAFTLTLTVADNCNRVVNLLLLGVGAVAIAIFSNHRSTFVVVHAVQVRHERNTDGLVRQTFLHKVIASICFLVSTFILEASYCRLGNLAFFLFLFIGNMVVGPLNNTVLCSPFVGICHPATIATKVTVVAIQQVLDWERVRFLIVGDSSKGFKGGRSGESPAWAALGLVNITIDVLFLIVPADVIWQHSEAFFLQSSLLQWVLWFQCRINFRNS